MSTNTKTYTQVDIRKVAECFAADLSMLARRTGTQNQQWAQNASHDVTAAAVHDCLSAIHVQLLGASGLIAAHKYDVLGMGHFDNQRPSGNGWEYNPNNELLIILIPKNWHTWEQLKVSGILKLGWGSSDKTTNYSGMQEKAPLQYSSNGYGWNRQSFSSR